LPIKIGTIMDTARIHRARSHDGTEIAGSVHGQGPPLILLHSGLGDGDLDCGALVPHLRDRFTCYLPCTRSRGLSGASTDLSPQRHQEDIIAFAESIGGPVGVMASSGGAIAMLGAAARTPAIAAVATYEPLVFEVLGQAEGEGFHAAAHRMAQAAEQGRPADAARHLVGYLADDREMAALEVAGYFDAAARYVPVLLGQLEGLATSTEPSPTEPGQLSMITQPLLILRGARAVRQWFPDSADHVAAHVPQAEVHQIAETRHHAAWVEPEPVAAELARFFEGRYSDR
jgi:pimeloyl-ACP methyl ester carboxylesterase